MKYKSYSFYYLTLVQLISSLAVVPSVLLHINCVHLCLFTPGYPVCVHLCVVCVMDVLCVRFLGFPVVMDCCYFTRIY